MSLSTEDDILRNWPPAGQEWIHVMPGDPQADLEVSWLNEGTAIVRLLLAGKYLLELRRVSSAYRHEPECPQHKALGS
jgi:hypothetical protein